MLRIIIIERVVEVVHFRNRTQERPYKEEGVHPEEQVHLREEIHPEEQARQWDEVAGATAIQTTDSNPLGGVVQALDGRSFDQISRYQNCCMKNDRYSDRSYSCRPCIHGHCLKRRKSYCSLKWRKLVSIPVM